MLEKIEKAIMPMIEEMELILYDFEYVKEGQDNFLRIYLDCANGIDLETIVEASRAISDVLDELDPIEAEYILEVSSPGAERVLKSKAHLQEVINEYIRVELKNPAAGIDAVEGYLVSFENDELIIEYLVKTTKKQITIAYDNVKKARLAIKF